MTNNPNGLRHVGARSTGKVANHATYFIQVKKVAFIELELSNGSRPYAVRKESIEVKIGNNKLPLRDV